MIFNQFDQTDIVAGRVSTITSGFWPDCVPFASSSAFVDNFWSLTQSAATPSPSYGASIYDIRSTMYYVDVYPDLTHRQNNDPYFSVAYGNFYGEYGSGSFDQDTGSILAFPTKAVYTQYKNMLIGNTESDNMFNFQTSSQAVTSIAGSDIFVVNFSSYKMKDGVQAGVFEMTLTGSNGSLTVRDDSPYQTQKSTVYNLIRGSINQATSATPIYEGIGLLYPEDGVVVFNAAIVDSIIGLSNAGGIQGPVSICPANYSTSSINSITWNAMQIPTTVNHEVFSWAIQNAGGTMKVTKVEYIPSTQYFVRVKNLDFNYSNNPTFVYDGTDGVHSAGTFYVSNFVTDPQTYITTVGLYNSNNQLVAVAKLSRPAVKSFNNELLIKVRLDF